MEILYQEKKYTINKIYGQDGHFGWLIQKFLSPEDQLSFYRYTIELSKDSNESKDIITAPSNKAYPITYYNLVYTNTSNCSIPIKWFNWALEIWNLMLKNADKLGFPYIEFNSFNSLYAQLFGMKGTMSIHKDEYVNWGISINLGADCDFLFGENKIKLKSGDIFIADFSKVDHAVLKVYDNIPDWLQELHKFNRTRMSIQIRDISNLVPKKHLTINEFKNLILNAEKTSNNSNN